MLWRLPLVCAALGAARCGPSPTVFTPERQQQQQGDTTLERLTAELARVVESSAVSATAGALQQMAESLGAIQQGLAAVADRLDAMSGAQIRLEETQIEILSRLESIQESHGEMNRHRSHSQHSTVTSPTAPPPGSRSASSPGAVPDSSAAGSYLETGNTSERDDSDERLPITTTPLPSVVRQVLGQRCASDSDCASLRPETRCGDRRVCTCSSEFRQVSDTECRRRAGLSERCTEDADCKVPDSTCTGGICNCTNDFWNNNNENCRRLSYHHEGSFCIGDPDCSAGLECIAAVCKCKPAIFGQYEFRVAGGGSCATGRVELRVAGGNWGYVCDDSWGQVDAEVFCRSLGFKSGKAYPRSKYGSGRNFYMDEVNCNGSEPHLLRCEYPGWAQHNCNADEVSSVSCSH